MNTIVENKKTVKVFDDLINPISSDDFNANYWEKQFLYIKRDCPDFYSSLLSIEDLDKLLHYHRPKGKNLRVVNNQQPMNPSMYENQDGSLNLSQLYKAYADGYSIIVNEIQLFWDPIKSFIQNMRLFMSHNVIGNMYLTPANEKALSPHYDAHDVFVLQVSGEKNWILYDDENFKTPLLKSFQPIFQREYLTGAREITLKAGDMMYIPRGVPHEAYTTNESSLHITLGVYSTQWIDLITKSLLHLSQNHIELRKALPIGFLNTDHTNLTSLEVESNLKNILQKVFNDESILGSFNILEEEFRMGEPPKPDGHFSHLDKMNHIHQESLLIKRENLTSKVIQNPNDVRILFQGNAVKGPKQIANTLEYISQKSEAFYVKNIPFLNDENRLKLAKKLVSGGLLKIVN